MDTKKLRQKILDLAIHGKLVPQDPNDDPASVLLERIRAEKERLIKEGKIKQSKKSAKSSDTPHYENEVPFEVPESWEWQKLGDIGVWQSGATPSRLNKDYYKGNIPWLKTGDLTDGFIYDIPETITQHDVLVLHGIGDSLVVEPVSVFSDSPCVHGIALFPDDTERVLDSGRILHPQEDFEILACACQGIDIPACVLCADEHILKRGFKVPQALL